MKESFSKEISSVATLHNFVDRFNEQEPISAEPLHTLRLALEELFTNMVKYSPEGREPVFVELERTKDSLQAHLIDYGVDAFDMTDPTQAPKVDVNRATDTIKPGGLGIHLTLQMIDTVEYEHKNGDSHIRLTLLLERDK